MRSIEESRPYFTHTNGEAIFWIQNYNRMDQSTRCCSTIDEWDNLENLQLTEPVGRLREQSKGILRSGASICL